MSQPEDTWQEWSRHVLAELKRLNETIGVLNGKISNIKDGMDDKIDKIKDDYIQPLHVEIAMLKVKSGMWGLVGGSIPIILIVLIEMLKGEK